MHLSVSFNYRIADILRIVGIRFKYHAWEKVAISLGITRFPVAKVLLLNRPKRGHTGVMLTFSIREVLKTQRASLAVCLSVRTAKP